MKKWLALLAFLFCALAVSIVAFSVPSAYATAPDELFSDDFNGASLDQSKWVAEQSVNNGTGGSITVNGSYVQLSSYGTSFPFVRTASNPFPASGDFTVEFDIQFTQVTSRGDGLVIRQGPFNSVNDDISSFIFEVWCHDDNQIGPNAYVQFFNKIVYREPIIKYPNMPWQSSVMVFRLQYCQGIYTLYLNGTVLASERSLLRAEALGFGHPPVPYLPLSASQAPYFSVSADAWTSLRVGSIRLLQPSALSLSGSPASISEDTFKVDLDGSLTDSSGVALPNEPVVLSYQIPSTDTWNPVTSTVTDSNGNFAATWFAPATGTFIMKAEWAGDATYGGTYQCRNVSITRESGQSLLLAESNSTLSALAFNSTSKEIAFTVSGPSGTTGYVRFLVSKALIDESDFKVYLDGKQLTCNITSQDNFLALFFQYSHSTHNVLIKLPTAAAATPQTSSSISPAASDSPTQQPASEPTLTAGPSPDVFAKPASNILPTIIGITVIVAVIVAVVVGALIYLKKRR